MLLKNVFSAFTTPTTTCIIDVINVRENIKKTLNTRFYPKNKTKTFINVIKKVPSFPSF